MECAYGNLLGEPLESCKLGTIKTPIGDWKSFKCSEIKCAGGKKNKKAKKQ